MLTIFNRRELTITYDMNRQAEIRDLLAQNGIKYSVKLLNRTSPSPFFAGTRAGMRPLGENLRVSSGYAIYVHKADYSLASAIINGKI